MASKQIGHVRTIASVGLTAIWGINERPPKGWATTSVGAIADLIESGFSCRRGTNVEAGISHLRPMNISPTGKIDLSQLIRIPSSAGEIRLERDDILFNNTNSPLWVGKSAVVTSEAVGTAFSNHMTRIRLHRSSIDPRLLVRQLNFLRGQGFFEYHCKRHINQASISREFLSQIAVLLPPLTEQQRILSRLHELDAVVEGVRSELVDIPRLLQLSRQTILIEALRGERTAEWRRKRKNKKSIDSILKKISVEPSKTGRSATETVIPGMAALSVGASPEHLPQGWRRVPLVTVARLESGHTPSRQHPEYWDGTINWISIPDAKQNMGKIIMKTSSSITEEGLANSAARLLPKGTVCVSRTASIGYTVVTGKRMATSQDFANWICSDALLPTFLMFAFLAEGDHLREFGKGTTHTTIYYPELKSLHITLPSLEEQQIIVGIAERSLASIEAALSAHSFAENELDRIEEASLVKAFKGKLVPQDSEDPNASEMLERIIREKEQEPLRIKPKKIAMKKLSPEIMKEAISRISDDNFTFEELRKVAIGSYEEVKETLFQLLSGDQPPIKQVFDKRDKAIRFERIK